MDISPAMQKAIQEALKAPGGGEVVVRDGSRVGRIYVCEAAIAWVVCSTQKTRLRDLLEEVAQIDPKSIDAVVEECQTTRANFGETLVAWGLVDRETLRRCLLLHNACHLKSLAECGEDTMAIFIPQARRYSGASLFSWEELLEKAADLLDPETPKSIPAPAIPSLRQTFEGIPGCTSLTVLDTERQAVRVTFPTDVLSEEDETLLLQVCTHFLDADTMPTPNRQARIQTYIAMNDDALLYATRGPRSLIAVAICPKIRNQGLTLGMARSRISALFRDNDWA